MNLQPASCTKKSFDTIEAAQAFATHAATVFGDTQEPYFCMDCDKYHNTSRPFAPYARVTLPMSPISESETRYRDAVQARRDQVRDYLSKNPETSYADAAKVLDIENYIVQCDVKFWQDKGDLPYKNKRSDSGQWKQSSVSAAPLTSNNSIDQFEARAKADLKAAEERAAEAQAKIAEAIKARETLKKESEAKITRYSNGFIKIEKYGDGISLSQEEWTSIFDRLTTKGVFEAPSAEPTPAAPAAPVVAALVTPVVAATVAPPKKFAWNLGVLK